MIKQSEVTIIIPHLGQTIEQTNALHVCLESLKETVSCPIIVVSNGITHPVPFEELKMHIWEQGQCKAVNAAVAITSTPWVLVTNDDMVYPPGWFERLISVEYVPGAGINPNLLCISPQLVEPRPGAPTFQVYFCGGAGGDFDKPKWLEFAKNWHVATPGKIRTGFNLPFLINRELWDTISGYDINYDPFGSNSDSDLEYKIRLAGVQPYQNTNSIVYHFSQTSGTANPENRSYWARNWDYFIEKWGFPRTDNGIWEANFDLPKPPIRKFQPKWEGKYETP